MKPTLLRCPNGHEVETLRRPPHMPCMACATEGRGVVAFAVVRGEPPPPERSEPPEPRRMHEPPAALVASALFKWDCGRDGHVYTGGLCGKCMKPEPADPAAGVAVAVALAFAVVSMCGCGDGRAAILNTRGSMVEVAAGAPCPDGYVDVIELQGTALGLVSVGELDVIGHWCAQRCAAAADCAQGECCIGRVCGERNPASEYLVPVDCGGAP